MTNYPRDEFDRVPEFSNRSGSHRANGWAAAASAGGVRPGLRWLMVFGVVALLVGVFSFTALPHLLNGGNGKTPASVAANSAEPSAKSTKSSANKSEGTSSAKESKKPGTSSDSSESAAAGGTGAAPSDIDADLSVKVGVYNGAKKPGLAGTVQTTLLNAGFTNVTAANWSKQVTYSTVYYSTEAARPTAERAAKELGISSVVKTTNIPGSVAVVLGNTFR